MAGIMNNTARQFNLKCINKKTGGRHVARIAPGFNVVDDLIWGPFKTDPYVKGLRDKKLIDFGKKLDDMELEAEPDTISKAKITPPVTKSKDDKK